MLLTSGSVFSDVSEVDALREEGCVVVDVLEVDLNVRVADKALAALVLSEHGEAPLRPTARLVSVQRLQQNSPQVSQVEKSRQKLCARLLCVWREIGSFATWFRVCEHGFWHQRVSFTFEMRSARDGAEIKSSHVAAPKGMLCLLVQANCDWCAFCLAVRSNGAKEMFELYFLDFDLLAEKKI